MEYKEKLGTITRVGPKKTEFNDGRKVTIGGRNGAPSYPVSFVFRTVSITPLMLLFCCLLSQK